MNRQGVWRLSPAYDMSYNHLLATIDGREYKYIIRKGAPEHEEITAQGLSNMTEAEMKNLVDRFLLPKTK